MLIALLHDIRSSLANSPKSGASARIRCCLAGWPRIAGSIYFGVAVGGGVAGVAGGALITGDVVGDAVGDRVTVVAGEALLGVGVAVSRGDCRGAVIDETSVCGIAIIVLS
jgi:hypothetical protein